MDRQLFHRFHALFVVLAVGATPAMAKKKTGMSFTTQDTGASEPTKHHGRTVQQAQDDKATGPESKVLGRALKLYDQPDYYSATIELNKVIEGQTGDNEANRQRAEFFMGKALSKLKFYSASLSYFDRIVQKGTAHRYYNKTLEWLASLSQYLPESAGVLDKIGKYTRQDLETPVLEPVRDQLFFLLGRYHYTKGAFKEALDLFGGVPESSPFYARAKFFEGMTYVRQYQARPATEAFKAILRKAIERPDKPTKEFVELANLSLARTFYSLHQFPLSTKYYDKIPEESPDWLPALFESSWSQFQMDGDSKALGNIHTLNAPFFENEIEPESLILKAVIYFQRCNYARAMAAIAEFNEMFPPLKRDIDALIARTPDNAEFYNYVLKIQSGRAGLPERVQRAAAMAVSDKTLQKTLDYVAELDRELKQIEQSDPTWRSTAVAGNILQDLTLQKSLAANEAGNLARERLKRLAAQIQELVKQAIKVEYETLNAQKGVLEASLRGEQLVTGPNRRGGEVVVDDEHERWPFDGEYWKDELGYYRVRVQNRCAAK